ncbi:alpha/beta hydrolase [Bacillus sp. ISL-35]|uniref:alpha/beta hydrolase n=1 Tax=Bacillus sp. ISL-35 TaxID=2819122 RepID=UPI001BEC8D89|nr:alpha/beta fold hydrolase [Bacillus sp. ISL-35]MBT2679871.1 alpha/beta hydrolase [Bacillus sp. ISL-35]MBT2704906.1 alpha/beta hydrolase [Chryseobacterium sp. ISL-80]
MMNVQMVKEEIAFKSDVMLKGTLLVPDSGKETYPTIMFLPGSGKLNRDGSTPNGKFKFNLYKDLAELCTSLGFATFRYDKRGVGESEGNYHAAGLSDALKDGEAALDMLAAHPKVDGSKFIIMGHSEGCMVGTALNAIRPAAGLVLLSGGGETLKEALDRQRQLLFEEMREKKGIQGFIIKTFNTLDKAEKQAQGTYQKMIQSDKDVTKTLGFIKMPAKYFREHFALDIEAALAKVTCPVLAINGAKDFQANPEKLKRIEQFVQGEHEIHVVENMDHGLKEQLTPMTPSTYKKDYLKTIGKPIHPEAVKHLTSWLQRYL